MYDATRNHESLTRSKLYRSFFEIDQQRAFNHVKELVIGIVLVPVILPFDNPNAHNGVVHFAERLVKPLIVAGVLDRMYIDNLERPMQARAARVLGERGCGFCHVELLESSILRPFSERKICHLPLNTWTLHSSRHRSVD